MCIFCFLFTRMYYVFENNKNKRKAFLLIAVNFFLSFFSFIEFSGSFFLSIIFLFPCFSIKFFLSRLQHIFLSLANLKVVSLNIFITFHNMSLTNKICKNSNNKLSQAVFYYFFLKLFPQFSCIFFRYLHICTYI